MNLYDRSVVRLLDIASIERARSGKTYPAGSTLIQVSATDGKLRYMDEPGEVAQKFAVIEPDRARVSPAYLFWALGIALPTFLARYQTTMNIQMGVFEHLRLEIHNDRETQDEIVRLFAAVDEQIDGIQRDIDRFNEFKKWHLDTMFV